MSWNTGGASNWNEGEAGSKSWNDEEKGMTDAFNDDAIETQDMSGVNEDMGGDFTCRSCGEAGHKARECPTKPTGGNDGKCFNCGEEGHTKAECTQDRVFKGECRICKQVGHPAADCTEKPPVKCFNCKEEDHEAKDCKSNRVFDQSGVENCTADQAWAKLKNADESEDLDDIRTAFKVYSRAAPMATYEELEQAFRANHFNTFLIAIEKELPETQTYVNLQGELDKTYQVGFHLSQTPRRTNQEEAWPKSPEENLERLKDAGLPLDRGIPKCTRCDELGHVARACPEEAGENADRVQVKCANCDEVGHRVRDCPTPRVDKYACRNCKQSGHQAAECTEPRSAEGVECRKCNEMGHFSIDCPTGGSNACRNCGVEGHISKECDKPRNPENVTCHNCDEKGHFSRDCPKPKDWSKVKCSNCGEMGHTIKRCTAAIKEEGDDFGTTANGGDEEMGHNDGFDSAEAPQAGNSDQWEATGPSGGDSWQTSAPAATASAW